MCNWTITWTEKKKEKAIKLLTGYFAKHGVGECIMQSDDSLIEAPELLADIADSVLVDGEGIIFKDNN